MKLGAPVKLTKGKRLAALMWRRQRVSTAEIAARLCVSRQTLQDHLGLEAWRRYARVGGRGAKWRRGKYRLSKKGDEHAR